MMDESHMTFYETNECDRLASSFLEKRSRERSTHLVLNGSQTLFTDSNTEIGCDGGSDQR